MGRCFQYSKMKKLYFRRRAVDGVFFVFIAVVIVILGGQSTSGQSVQGEACNMGSRLAEEVDGPQDGFARSFSRVDDKDRFLGVGGQHKGVTDSIDGSGIDNDPVMSFKQLLEQAFNVS